MAVTPHSKCKVVVNGVPITTKTRLQHLVNFCARPQIFLSPKSMLEVGLGANQLASLCGGIAIMSHSCGAGRCERNCPDLTYKTEKGELVDNPALTFCDSLDFLETCQPLPTSPPQAPRTTGARTGLPAAQSALQAFSTVEPQRAF